MEKNITVVVPGTGDERTGHDLTIRPGTRAADILKAVGLDANRFTLTKKEGDDETRFGNNDNVYRQVEDGEKLFAVPRDMTVG